MRVQFRSASDEHKEYNNTELLSVYFELYAAIFSFTSLDSEFNNINVSSTSLNKENLIKLNELILDCLGIWLEFPNSQEFLIHFLYEKAFGELYKRPAALYLLASVIKLGSFSDKSVKDAMAKIIKPLSQKDEATKRDKIISSLNPKEKIIDAIMSRNFFWDSKYMVLGSVHFCEAVISLQDYDLVVAVYNVFERNLRSIYDELKGDMQDENMMMVISIFDI